MILETSIAYPNWEIGLKVGQKIGIFWKIEEIGKNRKILKFCRIVVLDHFVLSKYTSCQNFIKKYWFLTKLEYFQVYESLTMRNSGHVYDDVIECHLGNFGNQNIFFPKPKWIIGIVTKMCDEKTFSSLFSCEINLLRAQCAPPQYE